MRITLVIVHFLTETTIIKLNPNTKACMSIIVFSSLSCCGLNNGESLVPDTIFSATAKRLDSDMVYTRREVSHSVWTGTCEIHEYYILNKEVVFC